MMALHTGRALLSSRILHANAHSHDAIAICEPDCRVEIAVPPDNGRLAHPTQDDPRTVIGVNDDKPTGRDLVAGMCAGAIASRTHTYPRDENPRILDWRLAPGQLVGVGVAKRLIGRGVVTAPRQAAAT
jgi:hypothetical protein